MIELVESGSHREFTNRVGTFFMATMVVFAVSITGYAVYDIYRFVADLGNQDLELVALVAPVPIQQEQPKELPKAPNPERELITRRMDEAFARIDETPDLTKEISKAPPTVKAAPKNVAISDKNYDPSSNATVLGPIGNVDVTPKMEVDEPPPPKKVPAVISGGVLTGQAINKPQPPYPQIAKTARASGTVTVQILVDETGKVVQATAVNGHPLLRQAAVQAAYQARFSPTKLSGQPVKVSGVISYNFILN